MCVTVSSINPGHDTKYLLPAIDNENAKDICVNNLGQNTLDAGQDTSDTALGTDQLKISV